MKSLYDVPAPAKLNLFLHITGRRADGYHLLQSVFVLIDWFDRLHFEIRQDGEISREDLTIILPDDDLIVRAARLLKKESGSALGAHIGIEKLVPSQAGMGGGSSDAATCLLALNRLWELNLPLTQLEKLGLRLGADVPFFLRGKNAWVEGIGDQITPLEGPARLTPCAYAVVKPAAGVNTAEIFGSSILKRDSTTATIEGFAADQKLFCNTARNDLSDVARIVCPDVNQALQWLQSRGHTSKMTGSGSAVFAALNEASRSSLNEAWNTSGFAQKGWQFRICNNLEVHPLLGWAFGD